MIRKSSSISTQSNGAPLAMIEGRARTHFGPAPGPATIRSEANPALLAVNGVGIAVAAISAARGLARPGYILPGGALPGGSKEPLTQFWAASSAVRTWAVAAALLTGLTRPGPLPGQLLAVAGLVQLGDAGLGLWQRKPDMTLVPAAMGLIHLASACRWSRARRPSAG